MTGREIWQGNAFAFVQEDYLRYRNTLYTQVPQRLCDLRRKLGNAYISTSMSSRAFQLAKILWRLRFIKFYPKILYPSSNPTYCHWLAGACGLASMISSSTTY